METDLGTKLDWVAADHYDTGQPHTHLVIRGVRDDGEDLIIPRKYISHTMRRRAQDLVEMELGPVTQIEGRVRLAHQVNAERFTGIDKSFAKEMAKGELNMSKAAPTGRMWHRQLQVKRLQKLSQMGLAENIGSGRWSLAPNYAQTLKDMGERGDIIKAIHRSLKNEGHAASLVTERNRFDPSRPTARPVTGVVKQFGRHDDTREGGFVIIRSLDGEHIHTKVSEDETFETLQKGQVITLQPHQQGPRKIDHSIADFAKTHDGIYSEARHATEGGNVSPAYAQAHVRRLEALRQKKLVIRHQDETWQIPKDYLELASNYEADRASRMPTQLDRGSTLMLSQMETARGVTWLDERLTEYGPEGIADKAIQASILKRRTELKKMGFKFAHDGRLPAAAIDQLRDADLRSASNDLSEAYGKPFTPLGDSRQVEGVFQETLERPSGKFAVIERSRDFTLVPWRPVMEKSRGRSISGRISAGGISWDVTKQRGLSR
jgi:predicted transcriptional regulator